MAQKKVLVTGGTGLVGKPLIRELLARGYEVHVTSRQSDATTIEGAICHPGLDLFDSSAIDTLLKQEQFGALAHLAWYCGPGCHGSEENARWVEVSIALLRRFHAYGGTRFLGAGSVAEYDYSYGYLSETRTPLTGPSIYGACKSAFYKIAQTYCKTCNLDFKWARIFNLYGPAESPRRLMPSVIRAMLKGEDVRVSPCTKIMDYSHVFDTAKGIAMLLDGPVTGAVNICSGIPVRLRTIVEMVAKKTEFSGKILWGAIPQPFDEEFVVGDNTRLRTEVGWTPDYLLTKGLDQVIQWHKENL